MRIFRKKATEQSPHFADHQPEPYEPEVEEEPRLTSDQ